jgi:hypothetical protein
MPSTHQHPRWRRNERATIGVMVALKSLALNLFRESSLRQARIYLYLSRRLAYPARSINPPPKSSTVPGSDAKPALQCGPMPVRDSRVPFSY